MNAPRPSRPPSPATTTVRPVRPAEAEAEVDVEHGADADGGVMPLDSRDWPLVLDKIPLRIPYDAPAASPARGSRVVPLCPPPPPLPGESRDGAAELSEPAPARAAIAGPLPPVYAHGGRPIAPASARSHVAPLSTFNPPLSTLASPSDEPAPQEAPVLPEPAGWVEDHPRSTWQKIGGSALSISVFVHLVFILLAIFFFVRWIEPPQEDVKFLPGGGGGGGNDGQVAHKIATRHTQFASTEMKRRISSNSTTASFTLPDSSPELAQQSLPMDFGAATVGTGGGMGGGRGTGNGTGIGSGSGAGKGGGAGQLGIGALIPTLMKGRCTDQNRRMMVRDAGGTPNVEDAVKKSLAWLKARQNPNGSWGNSHSAAMTGLVLLCYFGHCEGTLSKEYGDTVSRGITFLIDNGMRNQGKIGTQFADHTWTYEHAIGTYALAEALTFSRDLQFPIPNLEETVQKAATLIINGQAPSGGWDYYYKPTDRNDLSVAGWQMQALKAAKVSGVKLDGLDDAIRKAIVWLERDAYKGHGNFTYADKTVRPAMSPVGALCLQQWNKWGSRGVREPVELMMSGLELRERANAKIGPGDYANVWTMRYDGPNCDLYGMYYAVQVMRNAGGREWKAMNKAILAEIVPAQNSDGSFRMENTKAPRNAALVPVGTEAAGDSRAIYVQALNTLILQVYYRFLPATSAGSRLAEGLGAADMEDLR